MGHVAARHATEMLTTQNLTQLTLIAAISVIPVPIPPIAWEGAKLGYVLGLLKYSRGKEEEADHLGLELMNAAGYEPGEMAVVFGLLAEQEHRRGEHARLVQEPFASLWPALLRGLEEEGLSVAESDRARRTIATRPLRYAGADATRRLAEIADLSRARGEGMGRVSELELTY